MKIVFFGRALGPGGAERQMTLMAAGLQGRGHDVIVATFYPGGIFLPALRASGARHCSLEKTGRWDTAGFIRRFRQLLMRERPDVLYSILPTANVIAACCAPRIESMRHVMGIRVSEMQLAQYDWLERLIYAAEARLVQKARLVIFNSFSGYRLAQARGMALGASVVIPNGIDTNAFVQNETVRRDMRHSWRVADSESVVGMIGRFDPMKDHRTFAAAAEALLGRRPNLRFVLAGDGIVPENNGLSAMLRDPELSRRVLLLGERADVPAIMAGFDVLCLSSAFGEGFSNVLGEAMASGAPCVATDVGDAKEIIGDTGEVVAPQDPVALAEAVERLLGRLAQTPDAVRTAARQRIVENFSVDRLVVRTEEVLGQSAEQALEAA